MAAAEEDQAAMQGKGGKEGEEETGGLSSWPLCARKETEKKIPLAQGGKTKSDKGRCRLQTKTRPED